MDWKAIISQKYQEAWKAGRRKAGIRETRHLQARSAVLPVRKRCDTLYSICFSQKLDIAVLTAAAAADSTVLTALRQQTPNKKSGVGASDWLNLHHILAF